MKYLILPIILGFTLFACKKEDHQLDYQKSTEQVVDQDSLAQPMPDDYAEIKEVHPTDFSTSIKDKPNDTLYVTNFFATWCGPCMVEIPHFKEKMIELKDQPVKFTFVSLDNKSDWETSVSDFADEYELRKNIVLLDGNLLDEGFFKTNFKTWTGDAIPFTLMKKGNETEEFMGSMSKEQIHEKISKLMAINPSTKMSDQKEKSKINGQVKSLN